jgi:NAD(P)H-hydrate epimerase
VVDAILGTGTRGGLRELAATAASMINGTKAVKVAVDTPSGLDPLTGETPGIVVKADLTIALHAAKVGLRERDEYTGEVIVVPIGIDD